MKVGPGDYQGTHEKSASPSTGTPRHATSVSSSLYIMHFTSGHKTSLVVKNKSQPEPPGPATTLLKQGRMGYFCCSH